MEQVHGYTGSYWMLPWGAYLHCSIVPAAAVATMVIKIWLKNMIFGTMKLLFQSYYY
jgi:hypothetical protein